MNVSEERMKNSMLFKSISEEQWRVFNEAHRALYGEDYRHLNIKDSNERLFLMTNQKRNDGLINLVATRIKNTITGEVKYTIREDMEKDFSKFYKCIGQ